MLNILTFISLAGLLYCAIVVPNYNSNVSSYKDTKSKKVKDRILKKAKCKDFQQLKDKQLGGSILFVLCLIVLIGTQIIKGNSSYKPYMCNFKETDNKSLAIRMIDYLHPSGWFVSSECEVAKDLNVDISEVEKTLSILKNLGIPVTYLVLLPACSSSGASWCLLLLLLLLLFFFFFFLPPFFF